MKGTLNRGCLQAIVQYIKLNGPFEMLYNEYNFVSLRVARGRVFLDFLVPEIIHIQYSTLVTLIVINDNSI